MINSSNLNTVLKAYYLEKLSQTFIAEQFNLSVSEKLYAHFGTYTHSLTCKQCGSSRMESAYANRAKPTRYRRIRSADASSSFQPIMRTPEGYLVHLPECRLCKHTEDPLCACAVCNDARHQKFQTFLAEYQREFSQVRTIDIEQISAQNLFLIACFYEGIYTCSDKTHAAQRPPAVDVRTLTFTRSELREYLLRAGLLTVVHSSIERSIEMTSSTSHVFHWDRLEYTLPCDNEELFIDAIKTRCRTLFLSASTRNSVLEIWGSLAADEALTFYERLSNEHRLPFQKSPNIYAILRRGINEFGLSKTVRAISLSVRFGSARKNEEKISARHAANKSLYILSNYWLGGAREIIPMGRDADRFSEPKITSLFSTYFLPFAVDYCSTSLQELLCWIRGPEGAA